MRRLLTAALGVLLVSTSVSGEEKFSLNSEKEKVSYIIGLDLGNNLKRQGIDTDPNIILRGMKDAFEGNKLLLSEDEIRETMMAYRQKMINRQAEEAKKTGEKNRKDGEAFLESNSKKDGVITLPSGLQYKVISEGTGRVPKADDTVTVNYRGTLIDGTEFDSSYMRGQPASFPVSGVIKGWTEALQLMKEGAKWQLFIPSSLAYGEKGAGNVIGPNAALIFEVELISVK